MMQCVMDEIALGVSVNQLGENGGARRMPAPSRRAASSPPADDQQPKTAHQSGTEGATDCKLAPGLSLRPICGGSNWPGISAPRISNPTCTARKPA